MHASHPVADISADFGENLRILRKKAGFTQQQLADETGMFQSAIARLESGAPIPKLDTVEILAAALGVRPGKLVGWK